MLAYLFWHRPQDPGARAAYEHAEVCFHRSLARKPPVGLRGSAVFRLSELPWREPRGRRAAGYEDWYVLEDYAALGVLNEAAVGRGHRTAHDELARRFGAGWGGLYAPLEGEPRASLLAGATLAVWVALPPGARKPLLGDLLGDGMDPVHATLWRRQLVLGPAPEFCLLAREPPAGAAPARLPQGWTARTLARELVFSA